ncbi:MAG TPA: hypothetical protein VE954_38285 [Oligoflexus sp.]|uniref:hypothetical protein n=1 Tax=Oligoflexus sp. TaxID=1971216 RepID=UPI002D65F04F|nr:hypothetical protein [Oligoflexus sp.]HYX38989.1 hypothetical protein [Oligoflexus sp.]
MSGIRLLIAIIFLFAGWEAELRADASQVVPASCLNSPDILTNLNSKTSVDKMTQTVPERILWILPGRVIDPALILMSTASDISRLETPLYHAPYDPLRTSGSSPPASSGLV